MSDIYAYEEKFNNKSVWYIVDEGFIPMVDLKSVLLVLGHKAHDANKEIRAMKKEYIGIYEETTKRWVVECGLPGFKSVKSWFVTFDTLYDILADVECVDDALYINFIRFTYTKLLAATQQTCADLHLKETHNLQIKNTTLDSIVRGQEEEIKKLCSNIAVMPCHDYDTSNLMSTKDVAEYYHVEEDDLYNDLGLLDVLEEMYYQDGEKTEYYLNPQYWESGYAVCVPFIDKKGNLNIPELYWTPKGVEQMKYWLDEARCYR